MTVASVSEFSNKIFPYTIVYILQNLSAEMRVIQTHSIGNCGLIYYWYSEEKITENNEK